MWKKGTSFVHQISKRRDKAMKTILKSNKRDWRIVLGILGGLFLTVNLHAQLPPGIAKKLSPALKEEVEFLSAHPHYDYPMRVIVQLKKEAFEEGHDGSDPDSLPLVHGYADRLTAAQIDALAGSAAVQHVSVDQVVRLSGKPTTQKSATSTGPESGQSATGEDSTDGSQDDPTQDDPTQDDSTSHLRATLGVDAIDVKVRGKVPLGLDVGVAVLDSGIDPHPDLLDWGRGIQG